MKLRHPFFSPVAWLGTLLLLGLVGAKIHSGGAQVFSPGALSDRHPAATRLQGFSSHAEFEGDCAQCHEPWRGVSAARCLRCHAETARQIKARRGVHGSLGPAVACASCHPDHRGRAGAMATETLAGFDHARTGFRLDGAHAGVACRKCHSETHFQDVPKECSGCHTEPDGHDANYGAPCSTCHSTKAWKPARWDNHPFPLNHGERETIACATCHPVTDAEYTCYGCHEHSRERMARRHRREQLSDAELDNCLACHFNRRGNDSRREHDGDGENREHERGGDD